ncbi:MAG: hydantoinase/oxoprolinase family protein, partial [Gaiellales bacterium]
MIPVPPTGASRGLRLGIDIGGTFTDLTLLDDVSGEIVLNKALTTPDDPSVAVEQVASEALDQANASRERIDRVIHGTTLVANAIIERAGDRTALITTRGFRDALEIAREHRCDMYDLFLEHPRPLIPRYLRLEVDERILADGTVLRPLDTAEVEALAHELAENDVRAVAVSLLHSYRNPEHEREVGRIVRERSPATRVSLSSDISGELKEYQRTSTTACNVYVQDLVERYLSDLEQRLDGLGIQAELLVMLSSGGLATVETGRQFPVRILESGPAGGALAAAALGGRAGYGDLLSFDMGGTTAKLSVVESGRPLTTPEFEVDRAYRFKKGSGLPVRIPVIDMVEIGAGGGSIARVDRLGLLRVGPDSAGADPGPACYGRGGSQPTVTDADVVLGYVDPGSFLGGDMTLDVEAARASIVDRVGKPLGLDVAEAAWGIHKVVNESMASAARVHLTERGKDQRAFPIFAFGGAGPVHAYGVGALLGSPSVVVPIGAGVGSTLGFLTAPLVFDFVRTSLERLDAIDWDHVNAQLDQMAAEGSALLERSGVAPREVSIERAGDMRYVGQGHEGPVRLPGDRLGP